ncbi:MAG: hypothetical protein KDD15_23305, partial [Lewinella sp.]|nr:hypothetical protein [Lewinella sp.]
MKVLLKSSARSFCYCLLLSIYLPLYGQDNLTADGGTYEIRHDNNSKFQDFIIPSDLDPASGYNQLSFYLTGGDGGKRKIQFICTEPGGNGARVTAAFAIGDGLGELKPGGTIRFIVGQEGGSITSGGLAGAGGGGGTAVLYRAPGAIMGEDCIKTYDDTNYKVPSVSWQDTTCWVLLAVAGGGGGAYAPGGCAQSSSGKPGNAGINGTDGKGITAGKGGQNGDPGSEYAVGGLDGYGGSGGGFNPRGFNRATGEYGGIEGGRGGNTHSGIRIRGGDGYGGGGVGFHIFLYVRGGGGGGYSGGGHGSQYEGGGGGGSFLNPYAIMSHSEKKDGNGTDRSPDNGRVTYRFELNADLLDAPVASCEDVTVYISGDTETLRPEDADDSSYDPNDLPLDLRIREVQDSPGDNPWSYGTHFDCSDIGNSYTYSLQADNGFSQSQCEFTVEIEQGPVSTLVCPPSITVQPFDCLPIIGENLLYHYEGEAYFPDFEPQSQPACNSQGDYYIIRPDNSIDTTQNYPINDQLYRDTFAFGTSIVIYTATYTNAEDVEETQSCAFTVTVDPVQIAPRCPDNVQVELAADGCEAEISNILPDYECGELAYRIVGPELENPSITEGTGELNSFMALPGITTFEWRLADIPVAGASCSFTVSVDERNFLDRPTFTNCPTTADPYIYDGITQEEVLEQIDFAATDDCNVTGYELKGRNGGDFSLTCDDIGNNKRMEIWAYDGSGGHSVCELIVIPRGANGVVCRDDLRVELLPDHCNNMINFSSFDLAPFGLGCNQGFTYTIRDNENVLLDSGSGPIPDQQFGRGHYMASYHWMSLEDGVIQFHDCTFIVAVEEPEPPTAVCQNLTVTLSAVPTDLAEQVGAGSSDNCDGELTYSLDLDLNCAKAGLNTAYLTVTDDSGNQSTCVTAIRVINDIAPVVTACPQNRNISLDPGSCTVTVPDLTTEIMGTIACGSFSASQFPEAGTSISGAHGTVFEVGVGLTGENGSSSSPSCTVSFTIQDVTAPVAQCTPLTVDVDNIPTDLAQQLGAGSTDSCGEIASFSLSKQTFDCDELGVHTVTLTLTDTVGNASSCSTTITVKDNTPPTVLCQDRTFYITPSSDPMSYTSTDLIASFSDNCAAAPNNVVQSWNFDCDDVGSLTRQITVSDGNGNSATCTSIVTIKDATIPVAQCKDVEVALDTKGEAVLTAAQVNNSSSDNCGISSMSLSQTTFDCTDLGPNTLVLTVSDASGNTATCTTTVTVVDNTAPTASCQNVTVQLGENGYGSLTVTQVNNNS